MVYEGNFERFNALKKKLDEADELAYELSFPKNKKNAIRNRINKIVCLIERDRQYYENRDEVMAYYKK